MAVQKVFAVLGSLGLLLSFISPAYGVSALQNSSQVLAVSSNTVDQAAQEKLQKYLTVEAVLLGVQENVSVYFKDLSNGNEIASLDPTRSWIPASTIKAFVVLEAFKQRRAGLISFDQTIKIKAGNVVPTELETDEFPILREGTTATIRQLVEAMITQSDNTAYNTLLDILDRRNINATLAQYGITETVVGEKLNLDNKQFATDLQVPGRRLNTTTAKDLADFFDLLYTTKVPNAQEMLSIFKRQKINSMIPALLPTETAVAHKTGDWAPIYHDGGIIYKPDNPFILSVFTNSNDQAVIAKLARVAYFQDAQYVGDNSEQRTGRKTSSRRMERRVLAQAIDHKSAVLAATDQKTPLITAADLGITAKDLQIGEHDAKKIKPARIVPGSVFYRPKRFIEGLPTPFKKRDAITDNIAFSERRLSEVKKLLMGNKVDLANKTLAESETSLKSAIATAAKTKNSDTRLIAIKQANDLQFAILGDQAKSVTDKETYVNTIYNFYKKNNEEVGKVVNNSVLANPINQQPLIGIVASVSNTKVTLQFDDGTTKNVVKTNATPTREYHKDSQDNAGTIAVGEKIAVVGTTSTNGEVGGQFILTNIPKELPNQHTGTVIEIDPDNNLLRIEDQNGRQETVRVGDGTVIRSKDTGVALEGIMTGSTVTVFGETVPGTLTPTTGSSQIKATTFPTPLATILKTLTPLPSGTPSRSTTPQSSFKATPLASPTASQTELRATSVTVIKNSSGSGDSVAPKQSTQPTSTPKPTTQASTTPQTSTPNPSQASTPNPETPKPTQTPTATSSPTQH